MNHRRVVITGMGAITPLGHDVETTWRSLLAGRSGVGPITHFDPSPFNTKIAAEVHDFEATRYMSPKEARRTDRFTQFAWAATAQALERSGLKIDQDNGDEIGVVFGSAIGGCNIIEEIFQAMGEKGPQRVSPFSAPMMIPSMAASHIAIATGARGPNFCIASACATGASAIGEAWEMIRRGDTKAVIAGASEAALVPFALASFDRTGGLSRRNHEPERASRPFDAQRDGFVFGEGAGALVLEELEYALSRGAPVLAEVIGYGASADATHISAPSEGGSGAALAMARAIQKAGLRPEEVDYINAHGTSTVLNDEAETEAIKKVFGGYAYWLPISSTKSMTGHLLGAAGAVEAIVCVMTIRKGIIHPTINYEYPDPECDLDYVPNQARPNPVKVALSNSFGLGGHNACLLFRVFEE